MRCVSEIRPFEEILEIYRLPAFRIIGVEARSGGTLGNNAPALWDRFSKVVRIKHCVHSHRSYLNRLWAGPASMIPKPIPLSTWSVQLHLPERRCRKVSLSVTGQRHYAQRGSLVRM